MEIKEFTEKLENAIIAVNRLPKQFRPIGIRNDLNDVISVQLGRFYIDERLEDYAELAGLPTERIHHDSINMDEVVLTDDNGTKLTQMVSLANGGERLWSR